MFLAGTRGLRSGRLPETVLSYPIVSRPTRSKVFSARVRSRNKAQPKFQGWHELPTRRSGRYLSLSGYERGDEPGLWLSLLLVCMRSALLAHFIGSLPSHSLPGPDARKLVKAWPAYVLHCSQLLGIGAQRVVSKLASTPSLGYQISQTVGSEVHVLCATSFCVIRSM